MQKYDAALMAALQWGASAIGPSTSFDCKKAKTHVEKLVCADDELSAADFQLR